MLEAIFKRRENEELKLIIYRLQSEVNIHKAAINILQERLGKFPINESDKKTLLKLCHPDKHAGSKEAEALFKRINTSGK